MFSDHLFLLVIIIQKGLLGHVGNKKGIVRGRTGESSSGYRRGFNGLFLTVRTVAIGSDICSSFISISSLFRGSFAFIRHKSELNPPEPYTCKLASWEVSQKK